jgi:predicted DNA binding CopG/RHH family protein
MPASKPPRTKKPRLNLQLNPISEREHEITDQLMERLLGPPLPSQKPDWVPSATGNPVALGTQSPQVPSTPSTTGNPVKIEEIEDNQLGTQLPSLGTQSPRLDDQNVVGKTDPETSHLMTVENRYPSRVMRAKVGIRLPKHKLAVWKDHAYLRGIDFQDLVEQALDAFTGNLGTHMLINNSDDGLSDDVLNYYSERTGNSVGINDRKAKEEVAQYHPDVIKAAIFLGQHRAAKADSRISSFSYFKKVIIEVAEKGGADPWGYVKLQTLPKRREADHLKAQYQKAWSQIASQYVGGVPSVRVDALKRKITGAGLDWNDDLANEVLGL